MKLEETLMERAAAQVHEKGVDLIEMYRGKKTFKIICR